MAGEAALIQALKQRAASIKNWRETRPTIRELENEAIDSHENMYGPRSSPSTQSPEISNEAKQNFMRKLRDKEPSTYGTQLEDENYIKAGEGLDRLDNLDTPITKEKTDNVRQRLMRMLNENAPKKPNYRSNAVPSERYKETQVGQDNFDGSTNKVDNSEIADVRSRTRSIDDQLERNGTIKKKYVPLEGDAFSEAKDLEHLMQLLKEGKIASSPVKGLPKDVPFETGKQRDMQAVGQYLKELLGE